MTPKRGPAGLDGTRAFVTAMFGAVKQGAAAGKDLRTVYRKDLCGLKPKFGAVGDLRSLPAVRRDACVRRSDRVRDPRIWTAQRDKEMWEALERLDGRRSDPRCAHPLP